MKKLKQGFTLIELLIVIALLSALAVGLIAALDPLEQIKKGTDTTTRDNGRQVLNAIQRYYANRGNFPWCPNGASGANCSADPTGYANGVLNPPSAQVTAMLTELQNAGELKTSFQTTVGTNVLSNIFVVGSVANQTVSVCFLPTSKSVMKDPNAKFSRTLGPGANFASNCNQPAAPTAATTCAICIN
jgi:prepilin-type N-terminal cleavage/methylation domain-containing protein